MAWLELTIDTTHEAVDWVRTLLGSTDYTQNLQIRPFAADQQADRSAGGTRRQAWAFTMSFVLPADGQSRGRVDELIALLSPLLRTGLASTPRIVELAEQTTTTSTPFIHRIGRRFVIVAPGVLYEPPQQDAIVLRIGSSLSFGSGLHPATMLSLQLVERYVRPSMTVLDLGSGSGILSVAMAKLGARVVALDNDRVAVEAAQESVRLNGVEQQVTVLEGSLGEGNALGHWMGGIAAENLAPLEDDARFDLIVANILGRVHVALADDYRLALSAGGSNERLLITAGFTLDQEEDITGALADAGFTVIDTERLDEWVAFAYRLEEDGRNGTGDTPL